MDRILNESANSPAFGFIGFFRMDYSRNSFKRIPCVSEGIMNSVLYGFMILLLLSVGHTTAQTSQTFLVNGTYTVPAGVTAITVECWGAGGGGSNITGTGRRGGGGGGGAYARSILTVVPGTAISVSVGTGGNGSLAGSNTVFGASLVVAKGGEGGLNNGATGGVGGSTAASIGTIKYAGGNGASGGLVISGGGGGCAGSNGSGGNALNGTGGTGSATGGGSGANGVSGSLNGINGNVYGGGGSGAVTNSGTDRTGGAGEKGMVIITWICPVYSLTTTTAASACTGNTSTVSLSATTTGLPIGIFTVTYNLSGANPASGATATFTVITPGTAIFNTLVLTNPGTTTITITNLTSGGCSSTISSNNTST
ncbi:MAG: hypothetical protein ACOYKE_14275, partial [Ferruginibacter sp.]